MQKQPQFIHYDGSSQAGRALKALDPNYVLVDERSIKDLLVFAQKYSQELRYFNENNETDGTWAEFISESDLDEIMAYLKDPQQFQNDKEKKDRLTRPHLVLFITFLELIQHARQQLNDLTRRHLEFYYREALRMTSRAGTPDQVHVLVELADRQDQFLLPAGTLFQAGQDSLGSDLFYISNEDLIANRATVESVKTLFAEKQVIGIHEVRINPNSLIELFPANKDLLEDGLQADQSFIAMLLMALGAPVPGANLDAYPGNRMVNAALLTELDTLLDFIPSTLYMPFSTFHSLMQLNDEQALAFPQWDQVNNYLEAAARSRLQNPQFKLDRSEPANFEKNLLAALGRTVFGDIFNELPEVETIYELYRRRDWDNVIEFILNTLYMKVEDFSTMLGIVEDFNGRWRQIYEILRAAGKQKQQAHPDHELEQPLIRTYEADKFSALISRTLGKIDYSNVLGVRPTSFDDCHKRIIQLEDYFHVSAENFVYIRKINANPDQAQPWEWDQVYAILESAHKEKLLADRHNALEAKREEDGFSALILFALGDPNPGDKLSGGKTFNKLDPVLDRDYIAEELFLEAGNFTYLKTIQAKGAEATDKEWSNVYTILELAQRHKRKWTAPPAEIENTDRRDALEAKREEDGFSAMILFALGEPNPGDKLSGGKIFNQLDPVRDRDYLAEELFLEAANFTYVMTIQSKGTNATDKEWSNVYTILELAQRRKRKWVDLPAEIEKWENIYVAPDASQIQVRIGAEGKSVTPRWMTFGQGHVEAQDGQVHTVTGDIGFAIASPLLALAEGKRTITLTLAFQEDHFDKDTLKLALQDPAPFHFLLSTAKEMIMVEDATIQFLDAAFSIPRAERSYQHALQITLTLDEQTPAIAPLAGGIQTPWPVLQIMLADISQEDKVPALPAKRYRAFQNLKVEKFHLKVDVQGITNAVLQNNDSLLNPKKPFEPFGLSPLSGSSFYLAHPELCSKKLDELRLDIDWLSVADNLNSYYMGYQNYEAREGLAESPIADNTVFKARLKLYDNRSRFDVKDVNLFYANPKKLTEGAASINQIKISREMIVAGYPNYEEDIHPLMAPEVLDWSRYWQLELLAPDFQHTVYPRVAASCANKIDPKTKAPQPYIVNSPYTPKIKRLTAGYTASLEFDLTLSGLEQSSTMLYHIEPFGYCDLANAKAGSLPFLPQYENEGELFIGIKALAPPQDLTLLFQMAEGSADPSLSREPVHWSFLDGNRWYSLEEGRLLSDSTNGLLNSGIIKFDLPPVSMSTLLPADLYWIRATIARNSRSVGDIVDIETQAVSATFEDRSNDPGRLAQPLPAASISGLVELQSQVKTIQQPYSSFGGKSPEQAGSFYTRVSERLRHKNRALTSWDYERMVLEAFPGIYKVKCLPVGSSQDPRLADLIQIVVIPDIQGKLPFDPFEPKLPADVLWQIEQYLVKHSPAFARLVVKNPTYVRLKARLGVRLRPDANPGYYKNMLVEELQRYLAPWAYDRSAEIVFGGRINASLIVNFLEELPYVDYVAGVKLFTSLDGKNPIPYDSLNDTELEEVSVFAPDAILVSDRSHDVDLITEEGYEPEFFSGINYMKIELDFQIAAG